MKERKRTVILMIGILVMLLVVIGAAYAYLQSRLGEVGTANIGATSGTVDTLTFNVEKDLLIEASEKNFAKDGEDLSDSTKVTATLRANDATNEAKARYNIFIIIEDNDFVYTTKTEEAELVLNVKDPSGNAIKNIDGLKRVEKGWDITTKQNAILIVSDYEIEARPLKTDEWEVSVTLVNLESNQNENTGRTFSAKIIVTEDKVTDYIPPRIDSSEIETGLDHINMTPNVIVGSEKIAKYYYGIEKENEEVIYREMAVNGIEDSDIYETNDTSHDFLDLLEDHTYIIYSYVIDKKGIRSNIYRTEATTDEYLIPLIKNVNYSVTLNEISLEVEAQGRDGAVTTYYYSIDDGKTWIESTEKSHTFKGLKDSSDYKVRIKVKDENEKYSTDYVNTIRTEEYELPMVTLVNVKENEDSVTLEIIGKKGTNEIVEYEYEVRDEEGKVISAYQECGKEVTINGIEKNQKYEVRVRAIDSEGRKSNEYSLEVMTDGYNC